MKNLNNHLLPSVQILSFNTDAAFIYGKLRAELERKGSLISHTDMQIAAIALANHLTLVTGNLKHFLRIPKLKVENWL
jgi:predicted nucleic acid-binding protein